MDITAALLRSLGTDRKAFETRCDMIAGRVQREDRVALEAICRLYDHQTADEKRLDHTRHNNGIGFQQCDTKFGGKVARLYRKGFTIFPDKMERVRRLGVKYRAQLAVLSFKKDAKRAAARASATTQSEVCQRCEVTKCPDGCCCAC
jgi:hypothetical protein